jgi:hypothetical protein
MIADRDGTIAKSLTQLHAGDGAAAGARRARTGLCVLIWRSRGWVIRRRAVPRASGRDEKR